MADFKSGSFGLPVSTFNRGRRRRYRWRSASTAFLAMPIIRVPAIGPCPGGLQSDRAIHGGIFRSRALGRDMR